MSLTSVVQAGMFDVAVDYGYTCTPGRGRRREDDVRFHELPLDEVVKRFGADRGQREDCRSLD